MRQPLTFAIIAVMPFMLAACADKEKEQMTANSISRAQSTADHAEAEARQAMDMANQAKATADRALQTANAANDKADQMFQRGLRK
jgi:hypothetical protein